MRMSGLIIEFIKSSYIMIAFAFFAGVLLVFAKNRLGMFGNMLEYNIHKKGLSYRILLFLTSLFILWGYISKTAFYIPYNTGVQGDAFNFLSGILGESAQSYYIPTHIIFPWIGGQFIQFAKYISLLNPQEHLFRFKAMTVAAIPVHIFSLIGLAYLYNIFKILNFSLAKRILATLFLATTFGYWLWSVQPNSLAIALSLQCAALYYSIRIVKGEAGASIFLAPFFIAMVLYAHISSIFFVITLSFFLGAYLLIKHRKDIKGIIVYILTLLITGILFLSITSKHFNIKLNSISAVKRYVESMVIAEHYGLFEAPGIGGLLKKYVNNLGQGITNIFGFWVPHSAFDYILLFMILAVTSALFIYAFLNLKKAYNSGDQQERSVLLMLLLAVIIPFIAFAFKPNTMHYYVIGLVPNVALLLTLNFMADRIHKKGFGLFLVCFIIPALFLYNGFSSMNVLKGMDYRASEVYQKLNFLFQKYPRDKVLFFETYNEYENPYREISGKRIYFFQDGLTTDYAMGAFLACFKPAFPNIEWVRDIYSKDILNRFKKNKGKVIIGPRAYKKIKDELPYYISVDTFIDIDTGMNFYILGGSIDGG